MRNVASMGTFAHLRMCLAVFVARGSNIMIRFVAQLILYSQNMFQITVGCRRVVLSLPIQLQLRLQTPNTATESATTMLDRLSFPGLSQLVHAVSKSSQKTAQSSALTQSGHTMVAQRYKQCQPLQTSKSLLPQPSSLPKPVFSKNHFHLR